MRLDGREKMQKWLMLLVGGAIGVACSASGSNRSSDPFGEGTGGTSAFNITAGAASFSDVVVPVCNADCPDFPPDPIVDPGVPANAAAMFGDPSNVPAGGICIYEPEAGSLFPANWLRPRFRFAAPAGVDLFEIRLSTPKERNQLVIYTKNNPCGLPKGIWQALATNVHEEDIVVTVRGMPSGGGTMVGAQTTFRIAPVSARGSMVYWAIKNTTDCQPTTLNNVANSWLDGFSVGDEGVIKALDVQQVTFSPMRDQGANYRPAESGGGVGRVTCIGCHTSTPDGNYVLFDDHWPWGIGIASIQKDSVGSTPSYLTQAGQAVLSQGWLGVMATATSNPNYWSGDRHLVITSFGSPNATGFTPLGQDHSAQPGARLAWINLSVPGSPSAQTGDQFVSWLLQQQGTGYGIIARNGDSRGAMTPDWSDDGSTIVYVSTTAGKDGRLALGEADLYSVPFKDGAGGDATPIAGASTAGVAEYYPAISPDGKLVAFNRVDNISSELYYNPRGEIYVVPTTGGNAVRLNANAPVACLNQTSPGVINSWPKWSPLPITTGGRTYYWLIFSSAREAPFVRPADCTYDRRASQLYLTAVVVDANNTIQTYPAVYIWNQAPTSNHPPAWDVFHIPPVAVY